MCVCKRLAWILLMLCCAFAAETDEIKRISAMKGDSVTLHPGVGEMSRDTQILWLFGPEHPDSLIAEIYKLGITIFDSHEGFEDRLQMNGQTGSLTISNITARHEGRYTAQIMTALGTIFKTFHLIVYAPVPLPVIESSSLASESPISVRCSAENGPGVSLSWYKGRERLSQTSSPDLSVSLSLPLDIKERNEDVYHCVAANAVSNKTTQVSFQDRSPQNTEKVTYHSCGFTEAVIRLVVSAVVGVATIAIVVYDVRSGRGVDISHQLQSSHLTIVM